jgi:hypothetical protein
MADEASQETVDATRYRNHPQNIPIQTLCASLQKVSGRIEELDEKMTNIKNGVTLPRRTRSTSEDEYAKRCDAIITSEVRHTLQLRLINCENQVWILQEMVRRDPASPMLQAQLRKAQDMLALNTQMLSS